MNWINVSYNFDQTYIVKEEALIDAINLVFATNKKTRLIGSPRLSFSDDHNNLEVFLDIKVKKTENIDLHAVIKELANQVEESIKILIDQKPKNVQVALVDLF